MFHPFTNHDDCSSLFSRFRKILFEFFIYLFLLEHIKIKSAGIVNSLYYT
jgi:hypothetical protein